MSLPEKRASVPEVSSTLADHLRGRQFSLSGENEPIVEADSQKLHRDLKGRHMQMIAIGGAIGAGMRGAVRCRNEILIDTGVFVGSGGALVSGGPGSLVRYWNTMESSNLAHSVFFVARSYVSLLLVCPRITGVRAIHVLTASSTGFMMFVLHNTTSTPCSHGNRYTGSS